MYGHGSLHLGDQDVMINMIGGVKIIKTGAPGQQRLTETI